MLGLEHILRNRFLELFMTRFFLNGFEIVKFLRNTFLLCDIKILIGVATLSYTIILSNYMLVYKQY